MTQGLKVGDRVRVTSAYRLEDYHPGETGEVRAGPETIAGDSRRYYLVAIPKGRTIWTAVFADDEIEVETDVGPT